MKTESTPITIRLNDSSINVLKEEARRISYEGSNDTAYTDLIRNAIQDFVSNIDNSMVPDISVSDNLVELTQSTQVDYLLNADVEEWLNLFGLECNNHLTALAREQFNLAFESLSIPRTVLTPREYIPDKKYPRDVCSISYMLSRRGAIPDQIQEGDGFIVPTFQIACHPQLVVDSIFERDIKSITGMISASAMGIAKEESSNFHSLLKTATDEREPIIVDSLTIDDLCRAYDLLLSYEKTPQHMLLSPTTFMTLSRQASKQPGNWKFHMPQSGNETAGFFNGATILTSSRFEDNEVYFVANGDEEGFIEKTPVKIFVCPDIRKMRAGLVMWVDIGMFINDIMATRVNVKEN